jgi:hypothetical protein
MCVNVGYIELFHIEKLKIIHMDIGYINKKKYKA